MSRISEEFDRLKSEGTKGFIPFVSAGDPDLDVSCNIILKLAELGATVIELGVPFSDPMADGPTIQQSSQRALNSGTNLSKIFEMVERFRRKSDVPIVLFSYMNPLLRFGLNKLRDEMERAGVDGLLITDALDGEAKEISDFLAEKHIDLISLIAPTTTDERLKTIAQNSRGFLYAVSRSGVTGARSDTSSQAELMVSRARRYTDLPIAVGFGISTREQIEDVWRYADAAVVGSAIVAEIEGSLASGDTVTKVEEFTRSLLPQFAKSGTGL